MKLYLIVGVILVAIISAGVLLRPKTEELRKEVEASYAAYAKTHPDILFASSQVTEAHDYLIVSTYALKLGDKFNFSCMGGYRVKVCSDPDDK